MTTLSGFQDNYSRVDDVIGLQADNFWAKVILVMPIHAPHYGQESIATIIDSYLKRRQDQLSSDTFKGGGRGGGVPLTSSVKVSRVMANDIVLPPDSRSLSPLSSATCRKRCLGFPAEGRTNNGTLNKYSGVHDCVSL